MPIYLRPRLRIALAFGPCEDMPIAFGSCRLPGCPALPGLDGWTIELRVATTYGFPGPELNLKSPPLRV